MEIDQADKQEDDTDDDCCLAVQVKGRWQLPYQTFTVVPGDAVPEESSMVTLNKGYN